MTLPPWLLSRLLVVKVCERPVMLVKIKYRLGILVWEISNTRFIFSNTEYSVFETWLSTRWRWSVFVTPSLGSSVGFYVLSGSAPSSWSILSCSDWFSVDHSLSWWHDPEDLSVMVLSSGTHGSLSEPAVQRALTHEEVCNLLICEQSCVMADCSQNQQQVCVCWLHTERDLRSPSVFTWVNMSVALSFHFDVHVVIMNTWRLHEWTGDRGVHCGGPESAHCPHPAHSSITREHVQCSMTTSGTESCNTVWSRQAEIGCRRRSRWRLFDFSPDTDSKTGRSLVVLSDVTF